MSELSKIQRVGKNIDLGNDLKMEVKPLTANAMFWMVQLQTGTNQEKSEAMMEVVKLTVKEAIPEATDEEINNLPIKIFDNILGTIIEVNKLSEEETSDKKQLLKKIKNEST